MIKKKKSDGLSMQESKAREEKKQSIIQNKFERLSGEVKDLTEDKDDMLRRNRAKY